MEIIYSKEQKTLSIDGKAIGQHDNMLCLTDLIHILKANGMYGRTINAIMYRKSFREGLSEVLDKDLTKSPNLVRDLKKMGLYKTKGRRSEMRTYCHPVVFMYILSEYDYADFFKMAFSELISDK